MVRRPKRATASSGRARQAAATSAAVGLGVAPARLHGGRRAGSSGIRRGAGSEQARRASRARRRTNFSCSSYSGGARPRAVLHGRGVVAADVVERARPAAARRRRRRWPRAARTAAARAPARSRAPEQQGETADLENEFHFQVRLTPRARRAAAQRAQPQVAALHLRRTHRPRARPRAGPARPRGSGGPPRGSPRPRPAPRRAWRPGLVARAAPAGRMPGVTIRKSGPQASRTSATSCGEATTPSAPASCGEPRQPRDRVGSMPPQADGVERRLVVAGEDGDGEQAGRPCRAAPRPRPPSWPGRPAAWTSSRDTPELGRRRSPRPPPCSGCRGT